MKEKIKLKIFAYKNKFKGPNFKIFCDHILLDEIINYQENLYEKSFDLDLEQCLHSVKIEHFNKNPKDTIIESKQDVAIKLENLSFNGIKCSIKDLHENYFHVTNWRYKLESYKIKNNLYFGYNGYYEYKFETPSIKYILKKFKDYNKETFSVEPFDIDEDSFILNLETHIKNENL